jgi:2-hydroxy-6-oxonona-2,4-dienedioate hydrolase
MKSCFLLCGLLVFAFGVASAEECSIDRTVLERGRRNSVVICGSGIRADTVLQGISEAGVKVLYRQSLRRCEPEDRRPGLFLVLGAEAKVKSVKLGLVDARTQQPVCGPFRLKVVDSRSGDVGAKPFFLNAMRESDAKYVDVGGIRTRYFDKGEGAVMILVHGGQPSAADFNAWEWQQNFDGLAEYFRVIALDRIGQGYTDNPPDLDEYVGYYALVAAHLRTFIYALGLERVHLVGHSQGGWPVTRLALDNPDLVASLVIVDSTMVAPAENAAQAVRFYIYMQNQLHPDEGETPESIRRGMEFFSYTNNNITDQRVQRIYELAQTEKYAAARAWFQLNRMSPAHPAYRGLKAQAWKQLAAGELHVPTLIIWGREDPEGSFDAGVRFSEALKEAGTDVRFHAFGETGHVPYMEYPEAFNRVVIEFAEAHP